MSGSPALTLYRAAAEALAPFAGLWLRRRAGQGKEDPQRLAERYGVSYPPRPAGRLVWLHAASVGESGVALQLAQALAARDPELSFLFTTGTRTSADLIALRLPPRAAHVYAPLDARAPVQRFLTHWRPDLGVFVESEVWPNLILAAHAARIPLALANARMSPKSLARWARWPRAGARVLKCFSVVLAADGRTARALSRLSTASVPNIGNLKLAAAPPPVDANALAALKAEIAGRPVWLGASTHGGEDDILVAAHEIIRAAHADALLILVPRHPERGPALAEHFKAPRRALGEKIGAAPVYIADTLGELGMFYACANAAFVAGSLLPDLKGHNPVEPAKLGAPVITGPYVESFADIFDALFAADAAARAGDADTIARAIGALLSDEGLRARRIAAARAAIAHGGDALRITVDALAALLPAHADVKAAHASA